MVCSPPSQVLVADGSQLTAWDLRSGSTGALASLPQPPLSVMLAPAGGLSDAAAHLALSIS